MSNGSRRWVLRWLRDRRVSNAIKKNKQEIKVLTLSIFLFDIFVLFFLVIPLSLSSSSLAIPGFSGYDDHDAWVFDLKLFSSPCSRILMFCQKAGKGKGNVYSC